MTTAQPKIRPHLLWEFDVQNFDFDKSAAIVIERVVERGVAAEWREIIRYYGKPMIEKVVEMSRQLDEKHKHFTPIYLNSDFNAQ